jgi:hypothetical protein
LGAKITFRFSDLSASPLMASVTVAVELLEV